MSKIVDVTYYVHSGFSCAIDGNFFIFDYWRGQDPEELEGHDLTVEKLKNYKNVYVFITHSHPDHFDPIVYEWYKELPVNYIVSYEMPIGSRGKRMNPGDTYKISEKIQVKAFDSTDLGVSYLLSYEDINIFHAGDLNFWHWREESTAQEIDEAEVQFKNAMEPIKKENIDERTQTFLSLESFNEYMEKLDLFAGMKTVSAVFAKEQELMESDDTYSRRE